jgi:hypothetical protein
LLFKEKPKEASSALEKNDHPELDMSELLDENGIKTYQSMIGALMGAVSLGRFKIHASIMTMSQFRIAPCIGHLERLKSTYGYLKRYRNGATRVRTEIPDFTQLQDIEYDWEKTVYGNIKEEIPTNVPVALGNEVIHHVHFDANLHHCMITRRAITGVMHYLNSTLADWYCKKQATVKTATYGAEFVGARITANQTLDLRLTLHYLGVPITKKSFVFGDNNAVIISSTLTQSSLKKRHNALSYHRVRECIAAKIFSLFKIPSKLNTADVVSKHCGYQAAYPILKPLLFWRGDITDIVLNYGVRTHGECEDKI